MFLVQLDVTKVFKRDPPLQNSWHVFLSAWQYTARGLSQKLAFVSTHQPTAASQEASVKRI